MLVARTRRIAIPSLRGLSCAKTATRAAHICTVSSRRGRAISRRYILKQRGWQVLCRALLLLCRADQLLEAWVVLDVAPPPVRGPRQPDSVSGARCDLLLHQAECFVPVTQLQVRKRLVGKQFGFGIYSGSAPRALEHVSSAVSEAGARQHRGNRVLGLELHIFPQLRGRELHDLIQ